MPEKVTPAPVKIAAESVPDVTELLVSANRKNVWKFGTLAAKGAAEIPTIPGTPGEVFVAGTAAWMMEVTVVPEGSTPAAETVAPSKPAVEGKPPIWLEYWPHVPGNHNTGNARVPLAPLNVAQVVPAGTSVLFTALPAAIPVPLATEAEEDPLVAVRAELTLAQTARFICP